MTTIILIFQLYKISITKKNYLIFLMENQTNHQEQLEQQSMITDLQG